MHQLPAELRNRIYALLFVRSTPIFMHNRDEFLPARRPSSAYHDTAIVPTAAVAPYTDEFFNNAYETERHVLGNAVEFKHHLGAGIAILRTNRQINHEAAGTLYSHNSFHFTRITCGLHLDHNDDLHPRAELYHQFNYVGKWLTEIGEQAKFVKIITIDADARCKYTTHCEALPILKHLWMYAEGNLLVQFVHTGRRMSEWCEHPEHENDTDLENDAREIERLQGFGSGDLMQTAVCSPAASLNSVLLLVGVKDDLKLAKYSISDRLLSSVTLSLDGTGLIQFGNDSRYASYCRFTLNHTGEIQAVPRSHALSLSQLPDSVRERIYILAFGSTGCIVFDLDANCVSGIPLHAFHVNRSMREDPVLLGAIHRERNITILSKQYQNNFKGILSIPIKKLLQVEDPFSVKKATFSRLLSKSPMELRLVVDASSTGNWTRAEAIIDAQDLVLLLHLRNVRDCVLSIEFLYAC